MRDFLFFIIAAALGVALFVAFKVDSESDKAQPASAAETPAPGVTLVGQAPDEIERAKRDEEKRTARLNELQAELIEARWMKPPLVPPSIAPALARKSAELILSGRCRQRDLEYWGWGESSLRKGSWFTYCDRNGRPEIIYFRP